MMAVCEFISNDPESRKRLHLSFLLVCDRLPAVKMLISQEDLQETPAREAFLLVNAAFCRNSDPTIRREDCPAYQSLISEGSDSFFAQTTEAESTRERELPDQVELGGRGLSMLVRD